MKPEDRLNAKKQTRQSTGNSKLISRREVLNKAGLYALSAATMMVLMKSQPAMATSTLPQAPPSSDSGKEWRRTNRT